MVIARDASELPAADRAVAIGSFDGVHRGHRLIIRAITKLNLRSTVLTFDPHPRSVVGSGVTVLSSLPRRLELIEREGVDEALVLAFTLEMASLRPEEWIERTLVPLGTRVIAVGENFRFGHARAGDVELLRSYGFDVRATPILKGISSSRIRGLLSEGRMDLAGRLLGRAPEFEATVIRLREGRDPGVTTVALGLHEQLRPALPPAGVYAATLAGDPAIIELDAGPDVTIVGRVHRPQSRLLGVKVRVQWRRHIRDLDVASLRLAAALDVDVAG